MTYFFRVKQHSVSRRKFEKDFFCSKKDKKRIKFQTIFVLHSRCSRTMSNFPSIKPQFVKAAEISTSTSRTALNSFLIGLNEFLNYFYVLWRFFEKNKRIWIELSHKTTSSWAESLSKVIVKGNSQSPLTSKLIRGRWIHCNPI